MADLKRLLDAPSDTAELRAGIEKLAAVSQRMGQAMYARAAQEPRPGPTEHTSPPEDDGVVEAEIVDEDRDHGPGRDTPSG